MNNSVGGMRLGWPFSEKIFCVLGINTNHVHVISYLPYVFLRGALEYFVHEAPPPLLAKQEGRSPKVSHPLLPEKCRRRRA